METKELNHFNETVKRLTDLFGKMKKATSQVEVSELEKEGTALMREVQIVAPRVWEDFISVDRAQRNKISHGIVKPSVKEEEPKAEEPEKETPKKKPAKKKKAKKAEK